MRVRGIAGCRLRYEADEILRETFASELRYLMAVSHIVLANNQVANRFFEKTYRMPVHAWSTLYAVVRFPGLLARDVQLLFPRPQNSVSRAVTLLRERGWITAETSDADTRAKQLYPTEEGRRVLARIEGRVLQRQSEVFGVLTEEERDQFLTLCRKVILGGGLMATEAMSPGAEVDPERPSRG
ncbi:MarR family winged helix-turn-helix transcriptional regulator [Paracoccus sp. 1_MG-2023]|uniref:MarR family winged helix-turn-helix transcriptional regulator n=1 Tax=unclassified Paracoccus (in: a-proteobacteria) TaxID=2688777 RepID=UPI001C086268|nr:MULTISPECIES: MarR family winged helix-turn-helix transcriptional regulator [unclassified Paracoccus (in: a-proteobacteria)]MBU2957935.1 MarR family winged helix-turn-helix transcriptional regulator [Paracoccus sp. C2R09]MDO6668872.1 MarR family winged helix-turn-helix transcriptional regulator [Paracoccus sp. 1_MG-2023]